MSSVQLGKYRLLAELGRGGMAEVFLAVTTTFGAVTFSKLVVIKKPRENLADDVEFMDMFVDEARIAARLNHPNLVQTIEVGEADGRYFLVMEYLDGQPLHRILNRTRDSFPLPMQLGVFIDVLAGIHYAHELKDFDGTPLNIVHRDVTPHNCFVTYDGQVKVVDFGIAKAVGRAAETRHGIVKGKTAYLAPEQAASLDIDRRADIFTVGVMLFEAITRRRLWKGIQEIEIVRNLIGGEIPSPKSVDAAVDDELDRICRRALAPSPDARYPTASEFQRDLEQYLVTHPPRPSQRELGDFVAEKFADKRSAIATVIEQQLAEAKKGAPASMAKLTPSAISSSSHQRVLVAGPTADAAPPSVPAITHEKTLPPPPSHQPSATTAVMQAPGVVRGPAPAQKSRPIVIAIAVTAGVAALGFFALRSESPEPIASDAAPAPVASITVTLRATPPEARFTIDDGPQLENPFTGTFPKDGKEHQIRVVAPGYLGAGERVRFNDDLSFRFALARGGRDN